MCGAETKLFKVVIESAEMYVCRDCSKFGKIIAEVKELPSPKKIKKIIEEATKAEILQVIVEDYPEKIRKARESLNLDQKDFAKQINEKQAVVHKIETGSSEPNLAMARKLEKFLKIRLVEQREEYHEKIAQTKNSTFTIGDFIKIK